MDERKLLLGGAAAAVAYAVYTASTGAGKLQFGNVKKQSIALHLLQAEIYLLLPFINPTSINYPFRNITGSLNYGADVLADIEYNGDTSKPFVLQAGKSGFIPIVCKVNFLSVGVKIVAMIQNGTWLNNATLTGVVHSDINFKFDLKIF